MHWRTRLQKMRKKEENIEAEHTFFIKSKDLIFHDIEKCADSRSRSKHATQTSPKHKLHSLFVRFFAIFFFFLFFIFYVFLLHRSRCTCVYAEWKWMSDVPDPAYEHLAGTWEDERKRTKFFSRFIFFAGGRRNHQKARKWNDKKMPNEKLRKERKNDWLEKRTNENKFLLKKILLHFNHSAFLPFLFTCFFCDFKMNIERKMANERTEKE